MSESITIEGMDEAVEEAKHDGKSTFWESDHEYYQGTEIRVVAMRDPVAGFTGDYRVDFVDNVEGIEVGHYGPVITNG